jgi:hypothetical protein
MQIDYVKLSCKEDVHICHTNIEKKWNEICMKQLAGGKHMENDCFPRTLKFEMMLNAIITSATSQMDKVNLKLCSGRRKVHHS